MINASGLLRHHRSLVWNADSGLLLWEISRKSPEGVTCGVCRSEQGKQILEQYGKTLEALDRPVLYARNTDKSDYISKEGFEKVLSFFETKSIIFDRLFFTDPFVTKESIISLAKGLFDAKSLSESWRAVISQKIPSKAQRLSSLIKAQVFGHNVTVELKSSLEEMFEVENKFFENKDSELFSWDSEFISDSFKNAGFKVQCVTKKFLEKKRITESDIKKWFDTENSLYGKTLMESLGKDKLQKIADVLLEASSRMIFNWESEICLLIVEPSS